MRGIRFLFIAIFPAAVTVRAQSLDAIGMTVLRAVTTNLNGAGVRVAQPEAFDGGTTNWEVAPTNTYGQQPASLFTYTSAQGTTNNFPNGLCGESGHADAVGGNFYGLPSGVATNVAHVDNYDADYFYNNIIAAFLPPNINDPVVNQSYIFGYPTTNPSPPPGYITVSEQQSLDSQYDDYAAQYKTLFVSGAGNGGSVCPPSTCYNGISVGAYGGDSSTGPTLDNGRAKPDITVIGTPANMTSFSTPFVAGAAAVLEQAGGRGDGGGDTNSAADFRTVKALLLNGAVKPSGWTNAGFSPLDARYGAGVLNVFNAYEQLAGGKHGWNFSTNVPTGTPHPPAAVTNTVSVLSGWDFNTNTSSIAPQKDAVHHYYFNVTNGAGRAAFSATATLVWERQQSQNAINNLALFLYNCANSNLVACSTSLVDNVQQVFVPRLAPGRYDLQVWKAGGTGIVSAAEPYALAWGFVSETLAAAKSGTNLMVSWPVYPDGFHVEAVTNLSQPQNWSTNNLLPPAITNRQNVLWLNPTNGAQFFRLRTP